MHQAKAKGSGGVSSQVMLTTDRAFCPEAVCPSGELEEKEEPPPEVDELLLLEPPPVLEEEVKEP